MGRFLTHLLLTGAMVVAPVMRVLCYGSCAPDAILVAEAVTVSDATPECHERDESHHSTPETDTSPLPDDCTHGGESSLSSLKASAKLVEGDGPRDPLASTVPSAGLPVSSDVRWDAPPVRPSVQSLGLFLTPLRI